MNQILSQDEVDALLQGVTGGDIDTQGAGDEEEEVSGDGGIVPYDLTSQERIIRGRMPTLEIIHQRFSRAFRSAISAMLRRVVDVALVSTDMIKFGEFLKTLPVPTSLHIYKMEPLRGFALVVLETKLVFSLVDTLFGGTARTQVKVEGRDFTPIETYIIKRIVLKLLEDLHAAWRPVHELNIEYSRSEVNPQFAGIVPPSDLVVVVTFEMEIEDQQGNLSFCIPYAMIEPIRAKLHAGFQSDRLEVDHVWLNRLQERIMGAEVNVVTNLGKSRINAGDLMRLREGDIIPLGTGEDEEIDIVVEGVCKFRGKPGVIRGQTALEVTSLVKNPAFEE
ncbi:flagellar motor switch protein FliM [Nitrospinota bacterium]